MNDFINSIKKSARNTGDQIKYAISQFGKITSIGIGGKTINVQNIYDGEIRDSKVISPYGISSSSYGEIIGQTIVNDFDNNVLVGVFDKNKPDVKPGELILYNKGKCRVILDETDNIYMTNGKVSMKLNNNGSIDIDGDNINMSSSGAGMSSNGSNMSMHANTADININSISIDGNIDVDGSISINGTISLTGGLTVTYGNSIITISEDSIDIDSGVVNINGTPFIKQ